MKIEGRKSKRLLKEIPIGNCFYYDGQLCMRIEDGLKYVINGSTFSFSAIDFDINRIVKLKENTIVQPVNAKIVVE